MTELLQQLINGLALGSILALIALGYTMVYGILRFINFAHGDLFMLGAFAGFYISPAVAAVLPAPSLGSGLVVLGLAMLICAVLGVVIERVAYRPLRRRPKLAVLITAIGISLFLENTGQLVFGATPKKFPEIIPVYPVLKFGGLSITSSQLIVLGVTLLLLVALRHIVLKTRMGMAMRALAFNPEAAALMGINTDWIVSFTFGLGSALAAAAGILFAIVYPSLIRSWEFCPASRRSSRRCWAASAICRARRSEESSSVSLRPWWPATFLPPIATLLHLAF